ncbi:S-adenosyl-l-methionine hydroxide adenosyltransferase family protein [Belliella kenyensis]|uniref:S-adenosyl-l-methionine hydroxide adenosyltransferase family protein n=1 Tax=Belliella kenyensis TaxID=1472724 RepID=A0ABV8EJR9_9BACT|nr:SAM-dependent chlorinase/fluorinase [Belliella kenyensis]MCH7402700.1 SAM-dependent chlorinase/fluorinase [Belliella kenyensis]MDN3603752.1 SAM-dependent chlorinase/fluorinase [Belliella kenyensis]
MALVTFISDFGYSDYYVPAVKAKMLSINPQLNIVDISHSINTYDIAHAGFILRSVFRDFPKGTVHLVAMNGTSHMNDGYIGIKLEEHIFIGPNNGVLSLLADHDPGIIVQFADIHLKDSTFPTKDILAPIAAKVASGAAIHDFGGPLNQIKKMLPRQFKASKKQIVGHVIRVDNYGNLITNIRKDVFDQLNPGRFSIEFSREKLLKINKSYDNVEAGDCFAFFNSLELLEIGINHGHGSELLGLRLDTPIYINFEIES